MIGGSGALNLQSVIALVCSGYTIMTTIHAQDFADVEGDKISGRQTLPIAFPSGARVYIFVALISCSALLSSIWSVDGHIQVLFNGMGLLVAIRFYFYRNQGSDERTYVLYNVSPNLTSVAEPSLRFPSTDLVVWRSPSSYFCSLCELGPPMRTRSLTR